MELHVGETMEQAKHRGQLGLPTWKQTVDLFILEQKKKGQPLIY